MSLPKPRELTECYLDLFRRAFTVHSPIVSFQRDTIFIYNPFNYMFNIYNLF